VYVERELGGKLAQLAGKFPAIYLNGPRQSGKSTLLGHVFPGHTQVNLEEPDRRSFALDDPRGFLASLGSRAVIDEAQRAPNLFSYLQTVLDSSDEPGRFVLSGSQNFLVARAVSQSLAGRVAVLTLLPFSLAELDAVGGPETAEEWMLAGGYPRLHTAGIEPRDYFPSYTATYLERDVRAETGVKDIDRFRALMGTLGSRVGSPLNLADIGRQVGADARTVGSWLNILAESYIVFTLPSWHINADKRIAKRPKLFFHDTGLLCSLLGVRNAEQLGASRVKGHVFENAVVSEAAKAFLNRGEAPRLHYLNDHDSSAEIDLVVETGSGVAVWEIKASQTANSKYATAVARFQTAVDVADRRVVYDGPDGLSQQGVPYSNWRKLPELLAALD
jgi:predicted AAA+ superfamily ATPase